MANEIAAERRLGYRAIVFLIAVAAGLGFGQLASRYPVNGPELRADDLLARLAPRPARPDVVIIGLDDAGVKQYGPVKDWPRSLLAKGLSRVEADGPKAVVWDLATEGRTNTADDAALWRTIADHKNVILGMAYDAQRAQTHTYTWDDVRSLRFLERFAIADNLTLGPQTQSFPYDLFVPPVSDFTQSARGVGVFIRETDPDGVIRSARLFYKSAAQYPSMTTPPPSKLPPSNLADGAPIALPNLALIAALRVFDLDKDNVSVFSGDTVHLTGDLTPPVDAPVDEQGRMLIRYARPGSYTTYSFHDLVNGKLQPGVFKDKVVLFGATAAGDPAAQEVTTPLALRTPRVEVTADALATLMDRSYVGRYTTRVMGVMILIGLVSGLCLMLVSGPRAFAVAVLLLLAYLGVCYGLFTLGHTLLPIVPGLLVILVTLVVALALYLGPYKPVPVRVSPLYVPPPPGAVR